VKFRAAIVGEIQVLPVGKHILDFQARMISSSGASGRGPSGAILANRTSKYMTSVGSVGCALGSWVWLLANFSWDLGDGVFGGRGRGEGRMSSIKRLHDQCYVGAFSSLWAAPCETRCNYGKAPQARERCGRVLLLSLTAEIFDL